MTPRLLQGLALAAVFVASAGALDSMAVQDAEREQQWYCEMVREGHYPNYRDIDCEQI